MQLQSDPFVRKRTVRIIAIIDQGFAGVLLIYAAYQLIMSDFRDQNLIVFIGATENALIAIIFWLGVFALIGLQLVIAFLLLAATKDMTIDPETMMKKCHFWQSFSIILLVCLVLDSLICIYLYCTTTTHQVQRITTVVLHTLEIIFRIVGLYVVSKFIGDLHSLFGAPMVTHSNVSTPVMPRSSSMRSSMRSTLGREETEVSTPILPRSSSMRSSMRIPGHGGLSVAIPNDEEMGPSSPPTPSPRSPSTASDPTGGIGISRSPSTASNPKSTIVRTHSTPASANPKTVARTSSSISNPNTKVSQKSPTPKGVVSGRSGSIVPSGNAVPPRSPSSTMRAAVRSTLMRQATIH